MTTKDEAGLGFRNVRLARGRTDAVDPSDVDVRVLPHAANAGTDADTGHGDGPRPSDAIDLTHTTEDAAVTALIVEGDPDAAARSASAAESPATLEHRVRREVLAALTADPALSALHARTFGSADDEPIDATAPAAMVTTRRLMHAVLDGELPESSSVALGASRVLRRLLRHQAFSAPTLRVLEARIAQLDKRGADPTVRAAEDRRARAASRDAEERAATGIYVYTFPHYARAPYDDQTGRTLLRVIRGDRAAIRRFHEQLRATALPEDPVLVRVYATGDEDATVKERMFHRLLDAASHERSPGRAGSSDWFLTSVRFLDEIASTFGLDVRRVNDLADGT